MEQRPHSIGGQMLEEPPVMRLHQAAVHLR
jgi:hypothetical protein